MPSCNTYHLTWGFFYLGCGVSLHGCSSKVQPLLLTLDEGYLLTATPPDLECEVGPLGPPVSAQLPLLGHGVSFHSCSSKVQLLLLTFEVGKLLSAAPALSVVDVKCLSQDVQYYSGISQCLFRKTRTGQPVFDNT